MPNDLPSPKLLRKLLRYEPETGQLFWKKRPVEMFSEKGRSAAHECARWNARYANTRAGWVNNKLGYRSVRVMGQSFSEHRVVWVLIKGRKPANFIDHINGNPSDNRIENLRTATPAENAWNTDAHCTNKSGYKGVSWKAKNKKWVAQIRHNNKKHHLGLFDSAEEAYESYCRAAQKMHGEFAHTPNTKTPEDFL